MFCFGGRRLLPGVGFGLGGQPQPSGHVRRRGRLRAFTFEDAGLELTAVHGADLGLLIGDLQSLEGIALQGGELGLGMRAEAHRLLGVSDPARFPVGSRRARTLDIVLTERRGCVRWQHAQVPGQPWFRRCGQPLAEFPAPLIEAGGELVRDLGRVFGRALRPCHGVPEAGQWHALQPTVEHAGDGPGTVHRGLR